MPLTKKDIKELRSALGVSTAPKRRKTRTRKNRAARPSAGLSGSTRITRRNLLFTISSSVQVGKILVAGNTIPALKTYGTLYQELRIIGNIRILYTPMVSVSANGALLLGVTALDKTIRARSDIASMSPVVDTPVSSKASLVVNPRFTSVFGNNLAFDTVWFYLFYGSSEAVNAGELWIEYTVEMFSPIA